MGYKIGMPSLKLNNAGVKSKNCGSFAGVAREALEERDGQDPDIDRERSQQNIYEGYRTAADLMEYSRDHVEQLRDANGRKIRADAVVMCATILKPPAAYMATLSRAEQIRFLDVAEGVLADAIGRENIKSSATHFDELGTHRHVFWEPMSKDGRLCAKEVHNLKFFTEINRKVPAALREAGFDIDACEMYDAAKKDYEKEKAKAGRSAYAFKADAEKTKEKLTRMVGEKHRELKDLRGEIRDARENLADTSKALEEARAGVREVQKERNALEAEVAPLRAVKADMDACEISFKGLAFGTSEVKVKKAELDALVEQAKAGVAREASVTERERIASEREAAQDQRKQELDQRQQEIDRRGKELDQRDRNLSQRAHELNEREKAISYDESLPQRLKEAQDHSNATWEYAKRVESEMDKLRAICFRLREAIGQLIRGDFGRLNNDQIEFMQCMEETVSRVYPPNDLRAYEGVKHIVDLVKEKVLDRQRERERAEQQREMERQRRAAEARAKQKKKEEMEYE